MLSKGPAASAAALNKLEMDPVGEQNGSLTVSMIRWGSQNLMSVPTLQSTGLEQHMQMPST
jgi:hypothetical protein